MLRTFMTRRPFNKELWLELQTLTPASVPSAKGGARKHPHRPLHELRANGAPSQSQGSCDGGLDESIKQQVELRRNSFFGKKHGAWETPVVLQAAIERAVFPAGAV